MQPLFGRAARARTVMRTHNEHKIPVTSRITVEHVHEAATRAALARMGGMGALFMGSNLARGAAAFVTSLLVARTLGPDTFGRWTLCATWASMLTWHTASSDRTC